MARPRNPKSKVRPVSEILRAYTLLFTGSYTGIELPDEIEGMLMALAWTLGVPGAGNTFEGALAQVQKALQTVGMAEPEAPRTGTITNAREQQPQGEL